MCQAGGGSQADRLNLKEKELAAKEVELKKWEEKLKAAGQLKPTKNWPRCFPLVHHDIPGDVCPLSLLSFMCSRSCLRTLPGACCKRVY